MWAELALDSNPAHSGEIMAPPTGPGKAARAYRAFTHASRGSASGPTGAVVPMDHPAMPRAYRGRLAFENALRNHDSQPELPSDQARASYDKSTGA